MKSWYFLKSFIGMSISAIDLFMLNDIIFNFLFCYWLEESTICVSIGHVSFVICDTLIFAVSFCPIPQK